MAEFRFALRQTAPVLCGYLFLGLAFGLLLQQAGYGWPWALLISGIVYAGSMQFVLVGLLGGGFASLASVALTTLSVNSRHLFYGLSFLDTFRQMGRAKPYMIFSLSDETYSLQCSVQIPEQLNANRVRLWISALDQGYWVAGSVTGAALGSVLPFDLTGIDFAMTALFVVIFVDQWRAAKSHLPAVAGLVFGLVWLAVLGPDRFLLPALVCTVLALAACRGRLDAAAPPAPQAADAAGRRRRYRRPKGGAPLMGTIFNKAFLSDLAIVLVACACTVLTRALPFVLFGRSGSPGRGVLYLGRVLPPAVMAILVVYCLRSTGFAAAADFAPQLAAVAVVVLLHLWRRNTLLSIAGGTAVYMILLRLL